MTPETTQAIVDGFEQAMIAAGANSYEEAIDYVRGMCERTAKGLEFIRTKEHLSVLLEQVNEIGPEEERFAAAAAKMLPQLLATSVGEVVQKFFSEFRPQLAGRRPALEHEKAVALAKYVGDLHTQGCSLFVAKRRAADKFKVGVRTVERAWGKRAELLGGQREVTLEEARAWIETFLNRPDAQSA